MKKKSLENAKLYLILDTDVCGFDKLFDILALTIEHGVDVVQLRDKKRSSLEIEAFSKRAIKFIGNRIPFIINDYIDLAVKVGADGVHLGQDDMTIEEARMMMGKDALIGLSCQTIEQAVEAEENGADYVGFGSVFKTLTKPDREPMILHKLSEIIECLEIPVFAIGGITVDNLYKVLDRGMSRIAVCRTVCLAEEPGRVVRKLKSFINLDKMTV